MVYGHEQMQSAIAAIEELASEAGAEAWDWQAPETDESLLDKVKAAGEARIAEGFTIADKMERQNTLSAIRKEIVDSLVSDDENSPDGAPCAV